MALVENENRLRQAVRQIGKCLERMEAKYSEGCVKVAKAIVSWQLSMKAMDGQRLGNAAGMTAPMTSGAPGTLAVEGCEA